MKVVYERSGGIAGVRETLELELPGTLVAKRRGKKEAERPLEPTEVRALEQELAAAQKAAPPAVKPPHASDSFTVRVQIDGEQKLEASGLGVPPKGLGPAWDAVLTSLDRMLTDALRKAHPERPQILGSDEL